MSQVRGLNFVSADLFRSELNAQTSTVQSALKEVLREKYTPDALGGTVFYAGTVLKQIESADPGEETFSLAFMNIPPRPSTGTPPEGESVTSEQAPVADTSLVIRKFIVYIPEVHAGLPAPETLPELQNGLEASKEDKEKFARTEQKMASYTQVAEFNPGKNENIQPGDGVWIMFQNARTRENGFLISKIVSEPNMSGPNGAYGSAAGGPAGSGIVGAAFTGGSVAPDGNKGDPSMPPGYNGRWIVDYSEIIDTMINSKGCLYRYGWYPNFYEPGKFSGALNGKGNRSPPDECLTHEGWKNYSAKYPNANWYPSGPWEAMYVGLDCIGYCRYCLIKIGALDPKAPGPPGYSTVAYGIGQNNAKGFFQLFCNRVPIGQQVPGDVVIYAGGAHIMMVVSYPDPSHGNHSIVWGANGPGAPCDADMADSGIGVDTPGAKSWCAKSKEYNHDVWFKPQYGDWWKAFAGYYRVKPQFARKELLSTSGALEKSGNFPKNYANQYKYPASVSVHPPAVIKAPDIAKERRVWLLANNLHQRSGRRKGSANPMSGTPAIAGGGKAITASKSRTV
jgi:hypothetical protein